MEYLTFDFWGKFIKGSKFDGREFEKLVKELLPILGVRNLKETKISWDRSRDFQDRKKKVWAECKMYKEKVSIKIISPTLVMAVIDKPNTIYFFSYSPLNDNTIKHLSQFQNTTGVEIIVYDDKNLEVLILSNAKITKRFFPRFELKNAVKKYFYTTQINFSKYPEIEYYGEEAEDPRTKELHIYSVFSIDIFVRNLSTAEELTGKLSISTSDTDAIFLLNRSIRNDNYKLKINIHRGNLFFYRFFFKVLKCGTMNMPKFTLQLDGREEKEIKLRSNTIHVSSIIKTPLIGKKYIEMLDRFRKLVLNRNQPVFVNVFGESGTGKSRVLQEYSEILFDEEFNILKFNGEDVSEVNFQPFIRKVLSRVYKLPLVQNEQAPDMVNNNDFIYNILYNSSFIARDEIDKCTDIFFAGVNINKVALIIDNLQNFDEPSLKFIDSIISRIESTPSKFILICCFNTNLIYSDTKASDLFERFKLKNNKNTFLNEEVTGFDESAYALYLDNCIESLNDEKDEVSFSSKYPETMKLFRKHVLNRPLFIEQTLLYLEQKNAIKRLNDRLYISDINVFNTILTQDFPKNLGELIYKRWRLVKTNNNNNKNIDLSSVDETLKFLCFFNKIDYKYIVKDENTATNIRFLEKCGFIKIDERENVSFYHHQLFLCFRTYFREYSQENYRNYLNFLKENLLTNIFFHQYFILSEKLDIVETQVLNKALENINLNFQYEDFLIPFVYSVHKILLSKKMNVSKDTMLEMFLKLAKIVQVFESMNARVALLQTSRMFILENETVFAKYGASYVDFNHGLANAYITVHKDTNALEVLNKTANDIPSYRFNNTNEQDSSLGKIYNRLCVVYKALYLKEDALNYGELSLKIAKKIGSNELVLKNYIDIANVYGRDIKNKPKILSLWNCAVVLYNKNKNDLSSQRAMLQLYEAQFYLLEKNVEKSIQLLDDGVKYCEAHSTFFFGVKYLLLVVLSNLSFNIEISYSKLESCINKAKDWAIRYQINRTYWKVLFIEGKFYLKHKSRHESIIAEIFLQSLEQFHLAITNSQTEEYNANYFVYLTCFFRKCENKKMLHGYCKMVEELYSTIVKEKISDILQMNEEKFATFWGTCIPQSMFNDGKFDYPIIG